MTRDAAIAKAEDYFDSGDFRAHLARRVAIPTESQNPDRRSVLTAYIKSEMVHALEELGFACRELSQDGWPFLYAQCIEEEGRPTVLATGMAMSYEVSTLTGTRGCRPGA
ncbi:hypothetical protein ABIE78_001937 [Sinorhizobium fredii]